VAVSIRIGGRFFIPTRKIVRRREGVSRETPRRSLAYRFLRVLSLFFSAINCGITSLRLVLLLPLQLQSSFFVNAKPLVLPTGGKHRQVLVVIVAISAIEPR
jgi:hypothetical protein